MSRRRPHDGTDRSGIAERLRQHLIFLGFTHTLDHLDEHMARALRDKPAPADFLEGVLAEEVAAKSAARIQRRVQKSGLPETKTLEAFDWNFQPGLDKSLVLELATLDFVRRREDVIVTGKSGTGKSHILQAIALRGCQQQMSVRYARGVDLLDDLFAGLADGTYRDRLRRWSAPDLLVIDDVGLGQIKKRDDEPTAAHTLFNLIDRRHTHASTALTSNIKLSAWGRYLGDTALAAAVLDRLAMRAVRIDIDGPSYRQRVARERAEARGAKPVPDDDDQA